jgi:predicted ester cyclase
MARHLSNGTHQGRDLGISTTGRKMALEEILIYRLAENRVIEQWRLCGDL